MQMPYFIVCKTIAQRKTEHTKITPFPAPGSAGRFSLESHKIVSHNKRTERSDVLVLSRQIISRQRQCAHTRRRRVYWFAAQNVLNEAHTRQTVMTCVFECQQPPCALRLDVRSPFFFESFFAPSVALTLEFIWIVQRWYAFTALFSLVFCLPKRSLSFAYTVQSFRWA